MEAEFHDEIHFQVVNIFKAQNVAAYNFKVHKTVEYLDLSTNGCMVNGIKPVLVGCILTKEDMRKRMEPDRQILYKYHLDLPTEMETCCKKTVNTVLNAFHLREIRVHDSVFNYELHEHLSLAIQNEGRNKVENLKRYIRILHFFNFNPYPEKVIYLYFLLILFYERCTDSELVIQCVTKLNFTLWLCGDTSPERPCFLEYVLIQAQKTRCITELCLDPEAEMDPASECFFSRRIQHMIFLIKYGTIPSIPWKFDFHEHTSEDLFERTVDIGIIKFPRVFRIFQVFYVYENHKDLLGALRYIWRSIKDPFLGRLEMLLTLTPELPGEKAEDFVEYYVNSVIDEGDIDWEPSPRLLKDLCRVEIRRLLSDNYQLPSGISRLNIPKILKSYLILER